MRVESNLVVNVVQNIGGPLFGIVATVGVTQLINGSL